MPMSFNQRRDYLKVVLDITTHDMDEKLGVFLELARDEILSWRYGSVGIPDGVDDVPDEYCVTQVMACAAGFGQIGAPGQVTHSENGSAGLGSTRTWWRISAPM